MQQCSRATADASASSLQPGHLHTSGEQSNGVRGICAPPALCNHSSSKDRSAVAAHSCHRRDVVTGSTRQPCSPPAASSARRRAARFPSSPSSAPQDGRAMLAPLQDASIEGATPSVSFYDVSCAVAGASRKSTRGGVTRRASMERTSCAVHEAPELRRGGCRLRPVVQNQKTPPLTRNLGGRPTEVLAGLGLQKVAACRARRPGPGWRWTAGEHKSCSRRRCRAGRAPRAGQASTSRKSMWTCPRHLRLRPGVYFSVEAMVDAGSAIARSRNNLCTRPSSAPSSTRWSQRHPAVQEPVLSCWAYRLCAYELEKETSERSSRTRSGPATGARRWAEGEQRRTG